MWPQSSQLHGNTVSTHVFTSRSKDEHSHALMGVIWICTCQWIDVTRVELVKVGPHQRESKQKASENRKKKTKQSDASFNRQTNDSTLHASSSTVNTAAIMVYIRQSQLPKLKEYKYSGMSIHHSRRDISTCNDVHCTNHNTTAVDHSLLSRYVLKPYWWSQVINLFPMAMAPNAVCLSAQTRLFLIRLTMTTDHSFGLRFYHCKYLHHALLLPKHGPGLSRLGLLDLGCRPLPLPDFRRRGWHSSVCARQKRVFTPLNTNHCPHRRRTGQSGPLGELFDHGVDALNTSLEVLLFSAAMNFGQGWKTVLVLFGCS
jgi:hypothetical protein